MHQRKSSFNYIFRLTITVAAGAGLLRCSSTEAPPGPSVSPETSTPASTSTGQLASSVPMVDSTTEQTATTSPSSSSGSPSTTAQVSSSTAVTAGPEQTSPESSSTANSTASGSSASDSQQETSTANDSSTLPPEPEVDAFALAGEMGVGTNIGNTLENTTEWETGWGQPLITREFINGLASRGLKTVRVPVAWDTYATDGVLDPSKLERVREVVEWINEADLFAVVNIHWDGGWIFNEQKETEYQLTDDVRAKFESYWTQIASAFTDVGHQLVFEGMNEEGRFFVGGDSNGTPDYAPLNELNQLFVTTVRAGGGYNQSRALLVSGFQTDIARTCVDAFQIPNDPAGGNKLFLSLHYYTPYTFCGLDTVETWGSPATTWGSDAERNELQALFDQLSSFSQARNIPIILGEYGVTLGENYPRDPAARTAWMEAVTKACLTRGMVPVLWDTGSEIDRADGSFSPEFEAVMSSL